MRCSVEPRDVKGYGFLSLAKNMGKNLNNKIFLESPNKSATDDCSKKSNSKNSRNN